jgi:replicative DNA helicase
MNTIIADAVGKAEFAETAEEAAAQVRSAMSTMQSIERQEGLEPVSVILESTIKELILEGEGKVAHRILKTGLSDLDVLTQLVPGHLTIIAGRPAMGKSALAGNVAQHCAKDHDLGAVCLFSLEMDKNSLVRRMMANVSKIPTSDLPKKAAASSDKVFTAASKLHRLNLMIDSRSNINTDSMRHALERVGDVRLVVLDYLQLAKMDAKLERQDLRVGAVTKGLKAIAKEFDCHVIALSQLNRGVESRESKRPAISDLRDSGNIEQDADNIWMLYRDDYYNDETQDKGIAEINVAKNRHGSTGVVKVSWRPEIQTFGSLARRGEGGCQ